MGDNSRRRETLFLHRLYHLVQRHVSLDVEFLYLLLVMLPCSRQQTGWAWGILRLFGRLAEMG